MSSANADPREGPEQDPRSPTTDAEPGGRAAGWLLAAALILGLARFLRLGEWGLWIDEALTLNDAHELLEGRGDLFRGNALGLATIAAWLRLLGRWPDEADLRFLPALAGWLGIALTYWAFAPAAGRRRAAAAALLVAASAWHLYWSQNARFYTFAQALGLLAAGLYLRACLRDRVWLALLAALAGGLAALAHLSGALIPFGLVCAGWICALKRSADGRTASAPRRALTVGLVAAALVALPWIWNLWNEYRAAQAGKSAQGAGLGALAHMALTTGSYVTPVLGAGALAGLLLPGRRAFDRFASALCVAVGLLVAWGATQTRVTAQYVFVLLPWIAVLATRPLDIAFGRRAPLLAWVALALLTGPGLARQALYFTVHQGARPRWKEAYDYVWSARGPGDLICGMNPPVGDYYLSPGDVNTRVPNRVTRLDTYAPDPPLAWARYGRRMWLVLSDEWLEDWNREDRRRLRGFLSERCHLVHHLPLDVETRDLSVSVYRFDPE